MTRKLTLTSAVAVAALVFAAPAFSVIPRSDGSGGSQGLHPAIAAQLARQSAPVMSPGVVAARGAIAAGKRSEAGSLTVPDAFERAVANQGNQSTVIVPDAFERAVANQGNQSTVRRSFDSADGAAFAGQADVPVASATSSGGGIEWPQVGVGLGIGILLALGLGLIARVVHIRPFAH